MTLVQTIEKTNPKSIPCAKVNAQTQSAKVTLTSKGMEKLRKAKDFWLETGQEFPKRIGIGVEEKINCTPLEILYSNGEPKDLYINLYHGKKRKSNSLVNDGHLAQLEKRRTLTFCCDVENHDYVVFIKKY